jgi:hypothetical protein
VDKLLEDIIGTYETIGLKEAEKVKLFDRSDRKYIFSLDYLYPVLEALQPYYQVLEAGSFVNQPYFSIYYDTEEFSMFLAHHNNRPRRVKMRIREYKSTGVSFLEVKQKTRLGQTVKSREKAASMEDMIDEAHAAFIQEKTPFTREQLHAQLITQFNRITLISKERPERMTLDTQLSFTYRGRSLDLPQLVIAELKRESSRAVSRFPGEMKKHGIRALSVSKYCLGMALLNPDIKHNLFNPKLAKVKKLTQTLYHDSLCS